MEKPKPKSNKKQQELGCVCAYKVCVWGGVVLFYFYLKLFATYHFYWCVHACTHTHHGGQRTISQNCLFMCGLNSGCQAWWGFRESTEL